MKGLKINIKNWSPVIIKGACWVLASMFANFLTQTEQMTPDKLATWNWVDFTRLPVSVIYAGLITMMAFMDQIIARHTEKLEAEGKLPPPPIVEVTPQKEIK